MSEHQSWISGTRIILLLTVGLLLVLAWVGGRMSAGGAVPFGLMDGNHRVGGGHMHDGGGMMSGNAPAENGEFEGESGLRRCRAMMGTMTGMHRSMQSMMGQKAGSDAPDSEAGRMDRGMMGRMHGRNGEAEGHHGSMMGRSMMGEMGPDEMRPLCRTMHEAMRAAMHGDEVAAADSIGGAFDEAGLDAETRRWLQGARGAEAVVDRTGADEVVVEVGAGDGLRYAPAAVRVDPGTTVRWQWTGTGGLHDVAIVNTEVQSALRGEEGAAFTHTFDAPGAYRYECTPHSGVGMRGAVIVSAR